LLVLACLFHANPACAILINPGFETGDLTGWDVFDTCQRDLDCGVVNASVIGPLDPFSPPSPFTTNALVLEVGTTNSPLAGGGGVRTTGATERTGGLDISVDVAANCYFNCGNLDGGTVRLFFNGLELDNWSFGEIGSDFERTTLQGSVNVTAFDEWEISLVATRIFPSTSGQSFHVLQWFDSVELSGPATRVPSVPEPDTLGLLGAGLLGLGFMRRRRAD
jgi:hypothetical protein